ncbi:hypothetical protein SAMN05421819_1056 [Bryocella elongata]|uniref:Uncharacterized protein n=1 Tax=Bryocella elongata TaxID=863522 RepID=A0A1H5UJH8_9BACT|nr:hypothetical protein SAMN05421819_1056 [Bryocella elongata]
MVTTNRRHTFGCPSYRRPGTSGRYQSVAHAVRADPITWKQETRGPERTFP